MRKSISLLVILFLGITYIPFVQAQGENQYSHTVTGRITSSNPIETWIFSGQIGDRIEISMEPTSGDLDPVLFLIDPNNRVLADYEDTHASNRAYLEITLNSDGVYIVWALCYTLIGTSGEYRLTLNLTRSADASGAGFSGLSPGNTHAEVVSAQPEPQLPAEALTAIQDDFNEMSNWNWTVPDEWQVVSAQRASANLNHDEEWCVVTYPPLVRYRGSVVVDEFSHFWVYRRGLLWKVSRTGDREWFLTKGCDNWDASPPANQVEEEITTEVVFTPPYLSCEHGTSELDSWPLDDQTIFDQGFVSGFSSCNSQDGIVNYSLLLFGGNSGKKEADAFGYMEVSYVPSFTGELEIEAVFSTTSMVGASSGAATAAPNVVSAIRDLLLPGQLSMYLDIIEALVTGGQAGIETYAYIFVDTGFTQHENIARVGGKGFIAVFPIVLRQNGDFNAEQTSPSIRVTVFEAQPISVKVGTRTRAKVENWAEAHWNPSGDGNTQVVSITLSEIR